MGCDVADRQGRLRLHLTRLYDALITTTPAKLAPPPMAGFAATATEAKMFQQLSRCRDYKTMTTLERKMY